MRVILVPLVLPHLGSLLLNLVEQLLSFHDRPRYAHIAAISKLIRVSCDELSVLLLMHGYGLQSRVLSKSCVLVFSSYRVTLAI